MLCDYGCKTEANFSLRNGKNCCSMNSNSCQAIKDKNSTGVTKAWQKEDRLSGKDLYDSLPQETKDRMNWNKGNLTITDDTFTYNGKGSHKAILLKERGHQCESCKLFDWLENPIPLELEHIDGDNKNNTKDNLKLLCCNCHAQTPTWRRRKSTVKNNSKHSDEVVIDAVKNSYTMHGALIVLDLKWGSNTTVKRVMEKYNISFKMKE